MLPFLKTVNWRGVGAYLLVVLGTVMALHWSAQALSDSKSKGANVRNVLCEQLTEDDLELYKFRHDHPKGHGGLGEFITPQLVAQAVQKNAERRFKIGYAPVPAACHASITIDPYAVVKEKPKS